MNLNLHKNNSGNLHKPKNKGDAGYDLVALSNPKIKGDIFSQYLYKSISYIEYDTGVSISPNCLSGKGDSFFSLLFPRSSISKYNLSLCNSVGVIDSGYRDTIKVRFKYIPQPENYYIINEGKNLLVGIDESKIYKKGDRIAQIVFTKHLHPEIFIVDDLSDSDRGIGSFGSTGL